MAQQVASLYATIGAETSGLERGLANTKTGVQNAKAVLSDLDKQTIKNGYAFENLGKDVDGWITKLRAATPENQKYAEKAMGIVKAYDAGAISAKDAQKSMENLQWAMKANSNEANNLKMFMGDLKASFMIAAGAAAAFGVAAKKVYDFAKAGADIEYTKDKFDRLAISIGTTGDVLRNNLSKSMGGLLSKSDQMRMATDVISLGLVKNETDAVRLSSSMAMLGANMNQVVLALTNQTTARFDQIGISVDGFSERLKTLKESGMDAQSAFTEAFLEQAEAQIEKVGSIADSAAGSFKVFEASVKDFTDSFKTGLIPIVVPVIDKLTQWLKISNILNESRKRGINTTDIELRMISGSIKMTDQYADGINELENQIEQTSYADRIYQREISDLNNVIGKSVGLIDDETFMLNTHRREVTDNAIATTRLNDELNTLKEAQKANIISTEDYNIQVDLLKAGISELTDADFNFYKGLLDVIDANEKLKKSGAEAVATFWDWKNLMADVHQNTADAASSFWDLAESLKSASQQQIAKQLLDELNNLLSTGQINIDDYNTAYQEVGLTFGILDKTGIGLADMFSGPLQKAIADGYISAGDLSGAFGDLQAAAADGRLDYLELIDVLHNAGVISDETARQMGNLVLGINNIDLGEGISEAGTFNNTLASINGQPKFGTWNYTVKTQHIDYYTTVNKGGYTPYQGVGFYQSGGSFEIPPGYNENYPVGIGQYASSGETVSITPKGKASSNSPMVFNFYGYDTNEVSRRIANELRMRGRLS